MYDHEDDGVGFIYFCIIVIAAIALSVIAASAASPPTWGYQLQNAKAATVAASKYDIVVVDNDQSPAAVQTMKAGGSKKVIAYISVGEAEDYRWYWNAKAPYVGPENPDWKGNYLARYWDPSWQKIIDEYIDRIISKGFDGIYLDRVDVWDEWRHERKDAEQLMVEWVARFSARAKAKKPGFQVILQNAASLVRHKAMMDAIDGIAREELYYGVDAPQRPNSKQETADGEKYLGMVRDAGKIVLVVEYLTDPKKIADARARAAAKGFSMYIGNKELDRLF